MARNPRRRARRLSQSGSSAPRTENRPHRGALLQAKAPLTSRLAAWLRSSSETLASPPPGRARMMISIFIGSYLLCQVLLPLSYYLSDNHNDERFSWRMFSYLGRMQRACALTVQEKVFGLDPGNLPPSGVDLEVIAGNWVNLLKRGRSEVVEKFLLKRCEDNPRAIDVRLVRLCPTPDGHNVPSREAVFNCKQRTLAKNSW